MSEFKQQVEASRTEVTKLVFPHDTNHIGTLYGGTALKWMDEVGFLTASRFARQNMVTVSMDRIDFKVPIPEGSVVVLEGKVTRVGRTSLTINVEIAKEDRLAGGRELAISGELVFVAVDEALKPTPLSVHQA
ncbi:MAG: acyl-CoA thioesterase [Wenzhouxiangellaceae bacterium]